MTVSAVIDFFSSQLSTLLLSFGSQLSIMSLLTALLVAALFLAWQRSNRGRPRRWRAITRALFPKRIILHRSSATDLGYLLFNVFLSGIVLGWAVLSYQTISNAIVAAIVAAFGPVAPSTLPALISRGAITVLLFVGYEFGYWFDHWLKHKIPFLWEFHKVHHSAEVLTPITNFRVHPIDSWIFANILAATTALAGGCGNYLFGNTTYQYAISDTNLILVIFIYAYVHLQHTHMWIPFRGWLGRLLVSPAHHQIHHSTNPKHFNRNFGSCLALWDWMFGTLYVPGKQRERLTFGVAGRAGAHTFKTEVVEPLIDAAGHFKPALPKPASVMPAVQIADRKII
jgi:sterol desaturase/sphingolipid hydroxylase (fatty acid hydroxylase superfamily)